MSYISIMLFALSANLDNFIVGAAYGVKRVRINVTAGIIISFITMFGTILSMSFGERILHIIPLKAASLWGSFLIISMGLFYVINYLIKRKKSKKQRVNTGEETSAAEIEANIQNGENKENQISVMDRSEAKGSGSKNITYREAGTVAVALSLNNIALGIGASIAGLNLLMASVASFLFSFTIVLWGNRVGHGKMFDIMGHYAEPISGGIIILLGVLEMMI